MVHGQHLEKCGSADERCVSIRYDKNELKYMPDRPYCEHKPLMRIMLLTVSKAAFIKPMKCSYLICINSYIMMEIN